MTDWQAVRQDIEARLFRWALGDMEREIREGFPFLSAIQGRLAQTAFAYLSGLEGEQRQAAGRGLVKRFQPRAAEREGMPATAEEARHAERFLGRVTRGSAGDPGPLDRKQLLAALKQQLKPVMGSGGERFGAGEWRYRVERGPWVVSTFLDAGGRRHQLAYDHRIGTRDVPDLGLVISVLSWLGVAGQTSWDGLTDADVPETAELVARLCGHFLEALPEILPGDAGP